MTISAEKYIKRHTGNGVADTFSYDFLILSETHLLVVIASPAGAETVLALATDYTVSGVLDPAGGDVTLVAGALTDGWTISIKRSLPLTQPVDLINQGDFYAETVEQSFDRVVMQVQQVYEEVERSLRLPISASGVSFVLPAPVAGYLIGWNDSADALASLAQTDTLVVVQSTPPDPEVFKLWYNDDTLNFMFWDGSAWQSTSGTDVSGKMDLISGGTVGNLPVIAAAGALEDSGLDPANFLVAADLADFAPLDNPAFTTSASLDGDALATEDYVDTAIAGIGAGGVAAVNSGATDTDTAVSSYVSYMTSALTVAANSRIHVMASVSGNVPTGGRSLGIRLQVDAVVIGTNVTAPNSSGTDDVHSVSIAGKSGVLSAGAHTVYILVGGPTGTVTVNNGAVLLVEELA